ncbi:MAG TPA: MBL fold metallo-hydrolase [Mycobacteriales bacterium]|nr:MBL fold metallo-hydrolase [Mycobacteriales bacterium]
MRLTVVGCSGSFPGPDSAASCYLVEQDGYRLLLDLGSGALGELQRHVPLAEVDAIVLSHLHADHCLDVCPYVVFRRYHPDGPWPRIPLLGPAGTHDRLAVAYDPSVRTGLRDLFSFSAVTAGERELGPFRLRFERMNHPTETYGVRLEAAGAALTYSADTGVTDALVRLAEGSTALLCEASFMPDVVVPPDLHLTGREAGEHAAKAGVGRLLVTHVPPWADRTVIHAEAAAAYGGPTELVAAGSSYTV